MRAVILGKLARDSLTEKVIIKLKEIRQPAMDAYGESSQAEGTANVRVPRWECACCSLEMAMGDEGRE